MARTREVLIPVVRDPNCCREAQVAPLFRRRGGLFSLPPFALPGHVGRYVHFILLAIEICAQNACASIELGVLKGSELRSLDEAYAC